MSERCDRCRSRSEGVPVADTVVITIKVVAVVSANDCFVITAPNASCDHRVQSLGMRSRSKDSGRAASMQVWLRGGERCVTHKPNNPCDIVNPDSGLRLLKRQSGLRSPEKTLCFGIAHEPMVALLLPSCTGAYLAPKIDEYRVPDEFNRWHAVASSGGPPRIRRRQQIATQCQSARKRGPRIGVQKEPLLLRFDEANDVSLFGRERPFLRPGLTSPGAARSRGQAWPQATAGGGAQRP